MDDSSRYILAGGEFDAVTGENSISIVKDVLNNYWEIRKIEQIITVIGEANIMQIRKISMGIVKVNSKHSQRSRI